MMQDMAMWSKHYGIPLRLPSRFPLVTLRTQRALAAAELRDPASVAPFALALFRAYWAEDRDPTTDEVIGAAAPDPGILAAIDAPETKEHLRATTDEAVRRGAFGAPAMFVGDALFWGNDRIPLLEQFLLSSGA
jgi:2-hydroxychromene-2-carboxylate isomerase